MPLEVADSLETLAFYLIILIGILFLAVTSAVLVMHFLMPKAVLERYFKPPHFKDAECMLFSGMPYAPMRTIMLLRTIAHPQSGKVRGITEAHKLVPPWYRNISWAVVTAIYFSGVLILVFLIIGGLDFAFG